MLPSPQEAERPVECCDGEMGCCSPDLILSLQITEQQNLDLAVALEPNATFLKKSLQAALRHLSR